MNMINESKGKKNNINKSKTLKLSAMVGPSTFLILTALIATSSVLLFPTITPV